MKVVITGFPAFAGRPTNPTQELVETVHRSFSEIAGHAVEAFLLPVEYQGVERAFHRILDLTAPDLVLAFGVGRHLHTIRLETCGENLDDASIPDNADELRQGQQILEGHPEFLDSPHPIHILHQQLQNAGIASEISRDAGRYVCNHLLYYASHVERFGPHRFRFLFTHVPTYENGFSLQQSLQALQIMVPWFVEQAE